MHFGTGKSCDVLCRARREHDTTRTSRHARQVVITYTQQRKCGAHSLAANSSANILLHFVTLCYCFGSCNVLKSLLFCYRQKRCRFRVKEIYIKSEVHGGKDTRPNCRWSYWDMSPTRTCRACRDVTRQASGISLMCRPLWYVLWRSCCCTNVPNKPCYLLTYFYLLNFTGSSYRPTTIAQLSLVSSVAWNSTTLAADIEVLVFTEIKVHVSAWIAWIARI